MDLVDTAMPHMANLCTTAAGTNTGHTLELVDHLPRSQIVSFCNEKKLKLPNNNDNAIDG